MKSEGGGEGGRRARLYSRNKDSETNDGTIIIIIIPREKQVRRKGKNKSCPRKSKPAAEPK